MGGNRPKNHTPAKYVTVIDRKRGLIYYYALDQFGTLIYVNGQPKLEYTFQFTAEKTKEQERPVPETTKDEPLEMSLFQDDNTEQEPSQQEREFIGFHFYDEFKFDDTFGNYDELWAAM